MDFDIIIKNGQVIDGAGNPWIKVDVGVTCERISKVGKLSSASSAEIIDASGLVVCPGFIDMHTHSDFVLALKNNGEILSPFIKQGVTMEVIGNCGFSPAPIRYLNLLKDYSAGIAGGYGDQLSWSWATMREYLELIEKQGVSMNVAPLVGEGPIRIAVMGFDTRGPTEQELEDMKRLVAQAMEDGAFGMSSGLIYAPGMYTTTEELIELCKVVAKYGGIATFHIRGSSELFFPALEEIIRIADESGVSVEQSHHEATGKDYWWKIGTTLKIIDEARSRGLDITFDVFPYVAANTTMLTLFPPWSLEGGVQKFLGRLRDPATRERIKKDVETLVPVWPPWKVGGWPHNFVKVCGWDNLIIIWCKGEKNKKFEKMSIGEVAKILGKDPFDAISDLLLEENGEMSVLIHEIGGDRVSEEPMLTVLRHPCASIETDAIPLKVGVPPPGLYGAYPRVLGRYVRERRILTLEDAVRKMTSLPAHRLGIKDRGILREGSYADITIFNPRTIIDKSTYANPRQHPEGIEYVLINGCIVVRKGDHDTSILAGKVLRGPSYVPG